MKTNISVYVALIITYLLTKQYILTNRQTELKINSSDPLDLKVYTLNKVWFEGLFLRRLSNNLRQSSTTIPGSKKTCELLMFLEKLGGTA